VLHHIKKTKKKQKAPLDYILYFFVFTTPLFELPQAFIIYSRHDASGVSVLTWAYFAVSSAAWLIYGLRSQIRPIVFAYSLYLLIESSIVIGIIRYS
jgi:uncharacterized protein with PQ loop repeat